MIKEVKYNSRIYTIAYNTSTEKRPNGKTLHSLIMLAVDGIKLPSMDPFIRQWETYDIDCSIIPHVKILINQFTRIVQSEKLSVSEFTEWDGDLDKWGEL